MNQDIRILSILLEKINRIIEITNNYSREEITASYILSDAIQYEFEKMYEDSTRLSDEFKSKHKELHIDDLRGIRNRVAHNYESVSLTILFDTIEVNFPELKATIESFIEDNK